MRDKVIIAIKKKCVDCSGGSKVEVENCQLKDCALYPYRLGLMIDAPLFEQRKEGKNASEKE